jgi:hypothetical protein
VDGDTYLDTARRPGPVPGIGRARVSQRQDLDDWLARTPLIEIVFDDERLRTSSSARSG